MTHWTRRAVLRSGILASAAGAVGVAGAVAATGSGAPNVATEPMLHFDLETAAIAGRERILFDGGWRFSLGNSCDPGKDFGYGAMARERTFAKSGNIWQAGLKMDDSAWRVVDLPHDWAVELPFNSTKPLPEQGGRPLGREYPETSIGWYRKRFTLEAADAEKRIWLEFDGVMSSSDVFINGHYVKSHFSGYAPFRIDVTDWMNYKGIDEEGIDGDGKEKSGENVVTVRCDVTLGSSWFYEGAGVYRHVWLGKLPRLHIANDGSFAQSRQKNGATELEFSGEMTNDSDAPRTAHLVWELVDGEGKVAATQGSAAVVLPAWSTVTVNAKARMTGARMWTCEDPYCYTLRTKLIESAKTIDTTEATFGIRTILFDADKGFFLNGKPVKIKGTCNHQDHAGVGAALPDALNTWRLKRLLEMGSNAIRTSHNCPAPELIEAASRLGMMVMCETRMMDSNEEGLSQLTAMVRRYRNQPSIVIWSLGNEEPEQANTRGVRIVTSMKRLAKRLDPSRPTTEAMNFGQGKGVTRVVDVQGFNYNEWAVDKVHKDFPALPIIGTETASTLATRGIYKKDPVAGYVSAYDVNAPEWGSTAET